MKRHPALQDLSRDHYFVLLKCQLVRRALARQAPADELQALADDFLQFFDSDMVAHFQEEDDFVVPEAERTGDAGLREVAREIHADHAWLKARFADLRSPGSLASTLQDIEARLTRHVRLEEERLFEGVQRSLSEAELQAMWTRSFAFRKSHRAPAACRTKPASRAA